MLRASPERRGPTETPLSNTELQAWTEKIQSTGPKGESTLMLGLVLVS